MIQRLNQNTQKVEKNAHHNLCEMCEHTRAILRNIISIIALKYCDIHISKHTHTHLVQFAL